MSIFESYSILWELLPMYDYLEHWIWLMNQLSRKTRQIWKDYRLAFKNLDRETQTVLRYNKEFDDQLAKFLVRSSVLSCMSINFWISSDESFKKFVEMLPKFDDDKVIWFEFWGYKTKDYADFEWQLVCFRSFHVINRSNKLEIKTMIV